MRKRNTRFQPQTQIQGGHLRDKLRRQDERIEKLRNLLDASEAARGVYIAAMANFLGHDIKNCIQSMDAVLSANTAEELTDEHTASLRQQIANIRQTLAHFSEMTPDAVESTFKVHSLIGTLESLTRHLLEENGVRFEKSLPSDEEISVSTHHHSLLQVLYNLIINAATHLKGREDAAILLKVRLVWDSTAKSVGMLHFAVYDNGETIAEKMRESIFEFGMSTTGGTGIGLFHARYVCQLNKGSLDCVPSDTDGYTKCFLASLPIRNLDHE